VHADGRPKQLQYLSFSAYDDDFEQLARRITPIDAARHMRSADGEGIWIRGSRGTPVRNPRPGRRSRHRQVAAARVAEVPPGQGAATHARARRLRCGRGGCRTCCCSRRR
jgi:hypothetical protein